MRVFSTELRQKAGKQVFARDRTGRKPKFTARRSFLAGNFAASLPVLPYALDSHYHHQTADVITEPHVYDDGCFRLPAGPYSFEGKLITLAWALEAVIAGAVLGRLEITVSPTGEPVRLR